MTNSLIDHFAVPSECVPSVQNRTHSDGRESQRDHKPMTTETGSDYETSGHEGTVSQNTTGDDQDDGDEGDDPDRDGVEIPIADGGITTAACAHRRKRRYGRTDDEGNAVIEVRCASCGRTLSVGGDV